jgi:signal transduction histidine kinase
VTPWWWSAASVRARLTAWYMAALSLLLVVYAAATYLTVRNEFLERETGGAAVQVDEQLDEIREVLIVGLPIVVGLSGIAGYVLAGRALAPVEASFEQLKRFTADASHELRTPLSVLRGVGESELRQTRTAEEYKDAIGSMLEEVDRLTKLVETLLRLSQADAGAIPVALERVDLGELVRDVVSSLAILAEERRQHLRVDAAGGIGVLADRLMLREAIANVVDNAIKYGGEASPVDVRVRAAGGHATLAVTDSGPGIAPEHRGKVFDRFYRIDEARSRDAGGTGLGLSIAKWAVEANGGRVSVDAATGGGSVFTIVLPLASR